MRPPAPSLAQPVEALFGVGRKRAEPLTRLGIRTIEELLLHRPRRYEDRRRIRSFAELNLEEPRTTRGTVVAKGVKWFKHHTKSICEVILENGGMRLYCRWWNLPYMETYFNVGDEVMVYGRLVSRKPLTIDHPETEVVEPGEENAVHLNRIAPVYPLTEGVTQRWLRSLIWRTVLTHATLAGEVPLPPAVAAAGAASGPFLSRAEAIRRLHFPPELEDIEAARQRLALDELIDLQRRILARRRTFESKARGFACAGDNHLIRPFLANLSFRLTAAQTRVLRELRKDMGGPAPMRRLLQGDVGAGKTVVAACCALMALESGFNVALMAPTEILAEQHFATLGSWFKPLGVSTEIRTGGRKSIASAEVTGRKSSSASDFSPTSGPETQSSPVLFIGTHALIEAGFTPPKLGLVIIDEQHRFGVAQREALVRKGQFPHLLVMTATPIPRTLGLTLYGELDISTIDERPAGRGRLKTVIRPSDKLPQVWTFLKEELARGRQAFVIYPRIEEDAKRGVKALLKEFDSMRKALAPFTAGLLHGRLKLEEKDAVVSAFRSGELKVLLATSLIEVGIDVPNATFMVIENAEQFGLAQLHQMRGRIGRGPHPSYCVLVTSVKNDGASERLRALEQTDDGFRIAEADLAQRGPGDLLGQRQSGDPELRFAELRTDLPLVLRARSLAALLT